MEKGVVNLSKKTNGKNVQAVEAKTPDTSTEQPALPFDISKIPPESLQMAESVGIPIRQIVNWASSVEARLNEIAKTLPEYIQQKFAEQQTQLKQMLQPALGAPEGGSPAGGGLSLGSLGPLLKELLGSGGAVDPTTARLAEIGRDTIELSNFVYKEVIKKAIPGVVEAWEASKKVVPGTASP